MFAELTITSTNFPMIHSSAALASPKLVHNFFRDHAPGGTGLIFGASPWTALEHWGIVTALGIRNRWGPGPVEPPGKIWLALRVFQIGVCNRNFGVYSLLVDWLTVCPPVHFPIFGSAFGFENHWASFLWQPLACFPFLWPIVLLRQPQWGKWWGWQQVQSNVLLEELRTMTQMLTQWVRSKPNGDGGRRWALPGAGHWRAPTTTTWGQWRLKVCAAQSFRFPTLPPLCVAHLGRSMVEGGCLPKNTLGTCHLSVFSTPEFFSRFD